MTSIATLDELASQLCAFIARTGECAHPTSETDGEFNRLAAALFSLQAEAVPVYREFCRRRGVSTVSDWREIPALPVRAFKEYEITSLTPAERRHVFHSSGTMHHRPSRHFHSDVSRAVYEDSLRPWFRRHLLNTPSAVNLRLIVLTPPAALAPHSSLAHMFETVRAEFGDAIFTGQVDTRGAWELDLERTMAALNEAQSSGRAAVILGTAFSFVHLLDHCRATQRRFRLAAGSRALETGGYKGRAREVPKGELRQMMTRWLGIPESHILGEYGMSELSSQAYDRVVPAAEGPFRFPPWARAQIISPETGRECGDGETGMIRVFDLANVWSVLAVQTEDLGVRRGDGFELAGRAADAGARGCSLLSKEL
jgi:hypothetical protein